MCARIRHRPGRLLASASGSTMPIFAISLMAIFAMVGATIALGMDTRSGNQLQHSADTAALGGATAFINHTSPKAEDRLEAAKLQATQLASGNANYELADLAIQAVSEDAYGQHTQIGVELEAEPVNFFARFAGDRATAKMRRQAVAAATRGFPLCVLTLEDRAPGLRVKDRGQLLAENCIIWSNSANDKAMRFEGGKATAKAFCAAGQVDRDVRASVEPEPQTGCDRLPDPLEGYDLPVSGLCDSIRVSVIRLGSTRLSPGIYCGGLRVRARNVTLEPGVYFIREGGLEIDARGSITAEGVTFIFQGLTGAVRIKGGSGLTIKAPTEGETAGIAFAELDGLLPSRNRMRIRGDLDVEGVIYMPSYDIEVTDSGGGRTKSPYLQIVANSLEVANEGRLAIDFDMGETDLPLVIAPEREARLLR